MDNEEHLTIDQSRTITMTMTYSNTSPRLLLFIGITFIVIVYSFPLLTSCFSLWVFTWASQNRVVVGEQLNTNKKVEENEDLEKEKDFLQKYNQLVKSELLNKYKNL